MPDKTAAPDLSAAIAHYNQHRFGACADACRLALEGYPGHPSALHLLGLAQTGLELYPQAATSLRAAQAALPTDPSIPLDLAAVLAAQGALRPALAALEQARALAPETAVILTNMATLHQALGEMDDAERLYRRAIALDPDDATAHSNLGTCLLTRAQWREGFAEFEWRLKLPSVRPPARTLPVWRGQPLAGKHLLITAEQGYGDQIQYARFLPGLLPHHARVTVECRPGLERLLAGLPGVTAVLPEGAPHPAADYALPIVSLADRLGIAAAAPVPYLSAPTDGAPLPEAGEADIKIGLVWASQPVQGTPYERHLHAERGCPLPLLAPLAAQPGVRLYSLQQAWAADDLAAAGLPIIDLAPRLDDFAETAALIAQLDLVIAIDGPVAHLAGAMGKPLWVLLAQGFHDYRWGLDDTTPWYPLARLFRCGPEGWPGVVAALLEALPAQTARVLFQKAGRLHLAGALDEAIALYHRVLALDPAYPQAHCNLGEALSHRHRHDPQHDDEIRACYQRALELNPDFPEACNNLGVFLVDRLQAEEAETQFRRALALKPGFVAATNNLGNALLQQNRLVEAEALYRQVIAWDAAYVKAYNGLGNTLRLQGRFEEADAAYAHALELNPDYPEALINRAGTLVVLGRLDEAIVATNRALRLRPAMAQDSSTIDLVLNELAIALLHNGQYETARQISELAVNRRPSDPEPHFRLGNAYMRMKKFDKAEQCFLQAIAVNEFFAPAYNNLGSIYLEREETRKALAFIAKAVTLDAGLPDIHNNLGNALRASNQPEAAKVSYAQAIALKAEFPEAFNNLAVLLGELGQVEESLAAFDEAIRLLPHYAEAHSNRGNVLKSRRRTDEAVAAYRDALAIRPEYHGARLNLAIALLQRGDWLEGWEEYKARWLTGSLSRLKVDFTQPEWDGRPLHGETLLFYGEQGYGDVLQFIRYAPMLAARGARVVALVHKVLVRLFESAPGLAEVRSFDDPPAAFDYHLAMMSAPRLFATTPETIPAPVPYLAADPADIAAWAGVLAPLPGLKVGLVWSGDPRPHDFAANLLDRQRSLKLEQFAALGEIPGLSLVNLQMGAPASQLRTPPPGLALFDAMDRVRDFADTAALVANLDLVVTVDTSMAHLAGALGKPVWILSRYDGCWRWLIGRDTTPWYPTARLFLQTAPNDWSDALRQLADALKTIAA